jgi:hypothetical protein
MECRTPVDVEEFLINFEAGVYVNEAEESLSFVRSSWQRQIVLG